MRKNWTKEEDEILRVNHDKYSLPQLVNMLPGRNYNAVKARQTFLGVCKKYSKDEDFFAIPNTLNSSVSGIISSDGHISPRIDGKRSARLCIGLHPKDRIILEQISDITKSNYKIADYSHDHTFFDKRKNKSYRYLYQLSRWHVSKADKWAADLKRNWNIQTGAKSLTLEPPQNLTDMDCCLAFISGEISGDGTILLTKLNDNEYYVKLSLLGTEKLLIWVKKVFEDYLKCKLKTNVHLSCKDSKIYILSLSGIKAGAIIDKINQLNIIKLKRKWEKPEVLARIAQYKQKYPQYFTQSSPSPL